MIPFSLLLFFAPFVLLKFFEGKGLRESLDFLGFKLGKPFTQLGQGFLLFFFGFWILIAEGAVLNALGLMDVEKVAEHVLNQPLLVLAFAIVVAPVVEETFFRGFLQKKTGVVFSSAVFAVLHWGYGSVSEVAAAFTAGLVFGWWVRKNNTLIPAIAAHAAYNAMSILVILLGVGGG